MRILIVTHSAVLPTGMAETTRLIFNTLLDRYPGIYQIEQVGLIHLHAVTAARWPIHATRTLAHPNGQVELVREDLYGANTVPDLITRFSPHIVFGFNDPQYLLHFCANARDRKHSLVLYFNIDGTPIPPGYYEPLLEADRLVVSSEFGKRVFLRHYPTCDAARVEVIYSPSDTSRFVPVNDQEKEELRRELLPKWIPANAFILGWVGYNQWRKQVWILYLVTHLLRTGKYLICHRCRRINLMTCNVRFAFPVSGFPRSTRLSGDCNNLCAHCGSNEVRMSEPIEDIFLWLHVPCNDDDGAWPIKCLERLYDIRAGRDVHYTESCVSRPQLAPDDVPTLYQLWDALLFLSGGEGFGLPAWEAMSVKLPVVYTDYSSHAEFLRKADAGLPVRGVLQPEAQTCIRRCIANVPEALEAILKLYRDRELRMRLGENGRQFTESYNLSAQAGKWHRLFQGCHHK